MSALSKMSKIINDWIAFAFFYRYKETMIKTLWTFLHSVTQDQVSNDQRGVEKATENCPLQALT